MAAVLDMLAGRRGVKIRHGLSLSSRRRARGDLDHAVVVGRCPRYFIAVETKAERPRPEHLEQVVANAERASRRHVRGAPSYRIVVHPNSAEPLAYDAATATARVGLPHLSTYVRSLLDGAHPDRLVRSRSASQ